MVAYMSVSTTPGGKPNTRKREGLAGAGAVSATSAQRNAKVFYGSAGALADDQ
jgi:hypothetical protein